MSKTKADVLSSVYDLKGTVEFPDKDWYPEIRALTDAEFARAQSKLLSGQRIEASQKGVQEGTVGEEILMDVGGLIEGEFEARVSVVVSGLIENWTEGEVRRIPYPGAIEKICDEILDLGGHDLYAGLQKGVSQNVERFRSERGGAGDDSPSPGGSTSDDNAAGDDLHPEDLSEHRPAQSVEAAGG